MILYIIFINNNKHFYTFINKDNAINMCLTKGLNPNDIIEYNEDKVNKALQDDKIFKRIDKADSDSLSHDSHIAKNGYNRLINNLKKIGLTVQEWNIWCCL